MSSKRTLGNQGSVEEQTTDQSAIAVEAVETVEDGPELRASVQQDTQAKVDYADEQTVEDRLFGQTLAAEEKHDAREQEIRNTRERFDRRPDSDREARTRRAAARGSVERHRQFQERAASVDRWADPASDDPREHLTQEQLGAINQEAARLEAQCDGWTRAAISRRLAERVATGDDLLTAVVAVCEELERAPGTVIPIAAVEEVGRQEVSISGEVATLWTPSHPSISQVGLIEGETGTIKFTTWRSSRKPRVREGEQVVFRGAARNWYDGRVSVAVTGSTQVHFPERLAWDER